MITQDDERWLDVLANKAEASNHDTRQAAALRGYFALQTAEELAHAPDPEGENRLMNMLRERSPVEESAIQTAQIIVAKYHEQGDAVTQLKLQKLLYYVQGWSKALLKKWRFEDDIEAWAYGPVVYAVRQKFKSFGRGPIILDKEIFPADDLLIDTVLSIYGRHGAEDLVALTHKDAPWQKNYIPLTERTLIPNDDIEAYFSGGDAFRIKIHAQFFDTYRARLHDVREWTPPGVATAEEIAEIEAALFE